MLVRWKKAGNSKHGFSSRLGAEVFWAAITWKEQAILLQKRLKALIPADKEEVNFLYGNNLPKDCKILKAKDQLQASQPSLDSDYLARLATFNNWSMRGSSIHSSKLNSANWIIRKYRKLHIRICFARFSQIQLQLFTGKESIVLESAAGSCRSPLSQRVKAKFTYRKMTKLCN